MQEAPVRLFRKGDRSGRLKGRPVDEAALVEVRALIGPRPDEGHPRELLIEHLHAINDHWHGLHERHLAALAREMNIPMAEVFEVASFYHHFEILRGDEKGAALTVRVCEGLPCEMAGAGELLSRLPGLVGEGVKVVAAPCIGRCEQAPAVLVGQTAVAKATPDALRALLPPPLGEGAVLYDGYVASGGYRLAASQLDPESILTTLEHAGLRGLGGAGFPAGRKWRIVRQQPAPRLMAVNIDEGEPGTFKDRYYLERDPHRFLEGMLIAAYGEEGSAIYVQFGNGWFRP